MSLHVHRNGIWGAICDSSNTLDVYKDAVLHRVKPADLIWNGIAWQPICANPSYIWGFDIASREIYQNSSGPILFEHIVVFNDSNNNYSWGGDNDFVVQCTVNAHVVSYGGQQEVEIIAYNQFGTEIWKYGPESNAGNYTEQYDFPMNNQNGYMEIVANFTEGSSFTIETVQVGGSEFIEWGDPPLYPSDYDSNS